MPDERASGFRCAADAAGLECYAFMTGSSPQMDQPRQKRLLATCCGVHALHDGLVDMMYALLPVMAEAFGLSYAQIGAIRGANKTATATFQIPAGFLAERVGERGPLVLGTLLAGAAFVGLAFVDSFMALLVLFFLAGCGGAVQHPLSSALITRAFRGDGRRAALGTYNSFGDIGKFALMGGTVLALGLGIGWQAPVLAFGGIAVAVGIAAWLALRSADAGANPIRTAGGADMPASPSGWGIRHRGGFLSLGGIAALDNLTRNGFLTFVAFLMIEKGVATEWAAVSVLLTVGGGMLGKYACGVMAERIGVVRTIAVTEIATTAGIVAVVLLPSYAAFLLLPVLGVALNGTSSAIYGTVGEVIDERSHARAFGLIYTLGSVCGIAGPVLFGLLADAIGVSETLLLVGAAALFTLPICGLLSGALATLRAEARAT